MHLLFELHNLRYLQSAKFVFHRLYLLMSYHRHIPLRCNYICDHQHTNFQHRTHLLYLHESKMQQIVPPLQIFSENLGLPYIHFLILSQRHIGLKQCPKLCTLWPYRQRLLLLLSRIYRLKLYLS